MNDKPIILLLNGLLLYYSAITFWWAVLYFWLDFIFYTMAHDLEVGELGLA